MQLDLLGISDFTRRNETIEISLSGGMRRSRLPSLRHACMHSWVMNDSELFQRAFEQRAREQRLASIRASFNALPASERVEFGLWVVAEMAQPSGVQDSSPTSMHQPAVHKPEVAALGQVEMPVTSGKIRVGGAIAEVMRDGNARATGEISKAVAARFPDVNVNSIPAAVARMVSEGLLLKRGKNARGDSLYVIAPSLLNGDAAQASIDDGDEEEDDDDGAVDIDETGSGASRILAVFQRQSGMRVTLQSVIAELPDLDPNLIRTAAARFARNGKLKKVKRGVYRHIGTDE